MTFEIDKVLLHEKNATNLIKLLGLIDGGKWKRIAVNIDALWFTDECQVYLKSMIENTERYPLRSGFPHDVFSIILSLYMETENAKLQNQTDRRGT